MGRSSQPSERGASLVEFALIAPVLFAVLLGIFSGGIAYQRKITMTDAVREGARFGATLEESASFATDVQARTEDLSDGELTLDQICVRLVDIDASGAEVSPARKEVLGAQCNGVAEPSVPSGLSDEDCVVKVWARRTSDLEVIFFSRTLTLDADAVARYERDCS